MKALGIILSTLMIAILFNSCDGAIFSSSSNTQADGGPVLLTDDPPVIPEFGDVISCNPDFNLPQETLDIVGCDTEEGQPGIYLCVLPLDGVSQVETLCLTPDLAAQEVRDSCDCTIIPDEGDEDDGSHDDDSSSSDDDSDSHDDHYSDDDRNHYHSSTYRHGHWWKKWKKKKHKKKKKHRDHDCDSDDDSSDDGGGGTEVCVPSTTVQYRLGNCTDLF